VNISVSIATVRDAAAIAHVISQAAYDLTARFGTGHWSAIATEKGVLSGMNRSKVLIAKNNNEVVGTLRLTTTRPWVIDPDYFTQVLQPVYLVDMAIRPDHQRMGVGSMLIAEAKNHAKAWPGNCLRLDAYAGVAGAGEFYIKCGFTEKGQVVYKTVPHIYFEWLTEN
jgi:GNAT superfamily N-acetyltransferase